MRNSIRKIGLCPNKDDAHDVLHDAYVKAFERIDELQSADNFSNWLSTIVINTAKDALKRIQPISLEQITYETEEGYEYEFEIGDGTERWNPEIEFFAKNNLEEFLQLLGKPPDL